MSRDVFAASASRRPGWQPTPGVSRFLAGGSALRAVALAAPVAAFCVVSMAVFAALSFRNFGDGAWIVSVPLGWILGTSTAAGWGRTGPRPALLAVVLAGAVLFLGGFAVERSLRPGLVDPYEGVRDVDLALWVLEGKMPEESLRKGLRISPEDWPSVTDSQRSRLEASLLESVQARLEGREAPPRLTLSRFLGARLSNPFVFVCWGFSLALAWRAARGGDVTSLVWLARSELTVG
ncbi:MAG: hypothetical protein AAGK22_12620 [Acidobacteriota bacterium]